MAEEQARLGNDVSLYFVEKEKEEPVIPDRGLVTARAFPVTALKGHPGVSLPFARAINTAIQRFDVVHIHAIWNFPTFITMRMANRAGIPYVVAPQGSLEPWALSNGSWQRQLYAKHIERPLLNLAARLQALSETEASQFRAFGLRVPAAIIPNAVQPHWLGIEKRDLATELGLAPGTKTVLFLSRVHPKKGLDILLRAFVVYARERQDVALIVAGSDAGSGYGEVMRLLARDLGLAQRCRFLGEVSGEKKLSALAGADAFALTSHSEGLPMAVIEAMACGLPVVITPGCNLPEVESADAGLIVKPDVEATLQGLRALFADPERMRVRGENGRRLVRERFTWPKIAKQTVEVYREILGTAKQRPLGSAA